MLSPDTPSFDNSLEISFSDLTLNEVGGKGGNENNNNNNDSNHKNSPKLHAVPSAMEYIKKNYRNTQNISTSLLGQIFTGTHIETGQVHCIKICLKDMYKTLSHRLAENPRIEIETMEKICVDNHPYITQLIDAVEDSKLYVTFLEYISTGDMCSYLQKLGHGLSQTQALKYYKQLVEAVSFMHNKGYCHLDISLENILIDKANDCIKLCDFGLSRPFLRNNKLFPASNIRPGKTGYIAPEIMAYQSFDGAKADSFSLGVVLFIFLTGVPPFKAASPKDICFRYFFSGRTEYILREWKLLDVIPLQARQLLSKIFTLSESRISIHEIANHPWLQN